MYTQVMICGAGPVGLTLAAELKRYGVSLRIVDKAPRPTDKSKALVVWSRTLELLDRGIGAGPFVKAGFRVPTFSILSGDKRIGHVDMSKVTSPYPYALMLPQSDTERLLTQRLSEFGVTVERAVEMTQLETRPDGINATLVNAQGEKEQLRADWVVGCDGAHSIVRHTLGASFDGETNDSDWILADVHMTGYPLPDSEASVYWHKDGAFIVFPISPGRYRLLGDVPPSGADTPANPTLEQVQAIIDRRGPSGMRAFDPIWLAGFRINGRKVSRYRWGRAFLAGDAAHIHSPAGGQGMNTGMQDAFNLAWKLALVVRGICGDQLLDSYSPERSHVGDEVLKAAGRLTAVGTLRSPTAQAVRNTLGHMLLGLRPVQEGIVSTMTETSIGYPESPLNGPADGRGPVKPGERWLPVANETPPGSGESPRFRLVAQRSAATDDMGKRFEKLIEVQSLADGGHSPAILIRPDAYVAAVTDDLGKIEGYLQRLI
jgi:2-polyprenyl-6-methoxyphenol hydroxylase-like FAD-dependent oxidoreductase